MVESQIKQAEEDRKHEEEYAKMELVLQNNLMRTKVRTYGPDSGRSGFRA